MDSSNSAEKSMSLSDALAMQRTEEECGEEALPIPDPKMLSDAELWNAGQHEDIAVDSADHGEDMPCSSNQGNEEWHTSRIRPKIDDPSAVETRLMNGGEINSSKWSVQDMRSLYDAIRWYGTSSGSLNNIGTTHMRHKKSVYEVKEKIRDLRLMTADARKRRYHTERQLWHAQPRNVAKTHWADWYLALNRMQFKKKSTSALTKELYAQKSLKSTLNALNRECLPTEVVRVSDTKNCPKALRKKCAVDWQNLYDNLGTFATGEEPVRKLNSLESAIMLKIMDELSDEALQMPEDRKREITGLLDMGLQNDYRNFEPETAVVNVTPECAAREVLDPLRTREPFDEEEEEIENEISMTGRDYHEALYPSDVRDIL